MKFQARSGFTIVELVIVVVTIGILTTIIALTYRNFQQDTRNEQRKADIIALSEALEEYYLKKGEYPSCSVLSANPNTVVSNTLVGLSADALRSPGIKNATTSITCGTVDTSGVEDPYAYAGDSSPACQTGTVCTRWTLGYRDEATGSAVELKSRRGW